MAILPENYSKAGVFAWKCCYWISTLLLLCIVLEHTILADARSFPRSRTFRFPSSNEEPGTHETSPDNIKPIIATQVFLAQGRQSSSSIPISPPRPSSTENGDNDSSLEVSGIENDAVEIQMAAESHEDSGSRHHEDDELRNALCPPTNPGNGDTLQVEHNDTIITSKPLEEDSSAESNHLRYDLQVGTCAQAGKREHCGRNMIFVADVESAAYGYCECDFENKLLRKEGQQTEGYAPFVFHQKSNACYRLYSQAYCNSDEWLVLSRKVKGPACEQRKCSLAPPVPALPRDNETGRGGGSARRRSSKLLTPSLWKNGPTIAGIPESSMNSQKSSNIPESPFVQPDILWVPLNGTGPCVQLNKENSEYCGEGDIVLFNVGDIVPKCGFRRRDIEARATIVRNACPPGSFYSIIGRCQPDWDF